LAYLTGDSRSRLSCRHCFESEPSKGGGS
jgi:hypothetical protein